MALLPQGSGLYGSIEYEWGAPPAGEDHNILRDATSGTNTTLSFCQVAYTWDYHVSTAYFGVFQASLWFDLAQLPVGATIISASLDFTLTGSSYTLQNWVGSTRARVIGMGNANSTQHVDDYREMNNAPANLCTDTLQIAVTSATLDLNATGLTHIQNWKDSDDAVRFALVPQAMLDDYDPGNVGTDRRYRSNLITAVTLNIVYEHAGIVSSLGCNF